MAGTLATLAALAQDAGLDPRSSVKINFPPDSPLALVSADWGESRASARGGAMVLDLHSALSLRNTGSAHIRAVTLQVLAQDVTPGGKGSVSVVSLNAGPGETIPVRIDLRLLKPLQAGAGPLVQVSLDGVLFDDLTFYGPNKLDSRRVMTVWEMEARRDRQYFKSLLQAHGAEGLRREILDALARQAERPRLDVQMARGGPATNIQPERTVQFSFLRLPDSPVDLMAGAARVAGNEARAPELEVRNRSDRPVRHVEIGWIIRDSAGRDYLAGSVPGDIGGGLPPGKSTLITQQTSLRFSAGPGQPVNVSEMTGFVTHVEFGDGKVWVPARAALAEPRLSRVLAPSSEEQRLTGIYRRKGLAALTEELKKF
jgi:hypothetical protein